MRFYKVGVGHRVSDVFAPPILAYGSDGDSKEHGDECQKAVEPSSLRKSLPLDIASSGKERCEDTYGRFSIGAGTLVTKRMNQVLTIHYALQERPEKERGCVADSGHSERGRDGRRMQRWWKKEKER